MTFPYNPLLYGNIGSLDPSTYPNNKVSCCNGITPRKSLRLKPTKNSGFVDVVPFPVVGPHKTQLPAVGLLGMFCTPTVRNSSQTFAMFLVFKGGSFYKESHLPSLKLTARPALENRPGPKRKRESIPTIIFHSENVSFREGMWKTFHGSKESFSNEVASGQILWPVNQPPPNVPPPEIRPY